MKKVSVFLAEGFEENEALIVVDLLRRAEVEVTTVSITDEPEVVSSHKIPVKADRCFKNCNFSDTDMLVIPGGLPGVPNLRAYEPLMELLKTYNEAGKYLAAVCAGPSIFAELGFLKGKKGTCHPAFDEALKEQGVKHQTEAVVQDGNLITSRGLGTSIPFALKLVEVLTSRETAEKIGNAIVYTGTF